MAKAGKWAALEAASLSAPKWLGRPIWAGLFLGVECRAAQSRQARPEEAQEPSWGTLLPRLHFVLTVLGRSMSP